MFEFIRTHQRLMQFLLLVLIVPSFALIGVGGYSTYVSGDHDLVKIGDRAVTSQDFDQARRNQLQQMQQRSQGGFDPAVLDTRVARSALLDSLINRTVLIDTAAKERFSVSDTILRQSIAAMPEMQVDGRFSPERYNQLLSANGLSSQDFEQGRRSDLALSRVLGPVAITASVPTVVVESLAQTLTAQRTIRVRAFPVSEYEKDVGITESDITAWYETNKEQLKLPQQVSIHYLLLDEAAAMHNLPAPSPEEMHKYYDQNKARYIVPSRVNVSHILISVAPDASDEQRKTALDKARNIAQKAAQDPAAFADIARAESQDAGTAKDGGMLGWITHGSWPKELEDAVFALETGEVSEPVEGAGGYHIFLANDVQPEKGQTFEQAKAKIESEIRRQLGADRYADMATKLTGLVYDNPDSLKPAADALGLQVRTATGVAQDRLLDADLVGENAASASPDAAILGDVRVRRAVFSTKTLADKQNSGVIEISPDTMIVARVDTMTPAHVPDVAKVSDLIREQLTAERGRAAAAQAGQDALAAYQKEGGDTVPDDFGSSMDVSRIDPQGVNSLILDAAFDVPTTTLPQYVGVQAPQGYVIVRVEHAEPGKTNDPSLATLPQELNRAWGQAEEQAVLKALRIQAGVEMLPEAEKALAGDAES